MSEEKPTKTVLIKLYVVKTWWRELWEDFCSFSVLVGIFGVGWFFDSSAMQWFGFFCAFLIMLSRASAVTKKMTPQETADFLRDEYGVAAKLPEPPK